MNNRLIVVFVILLISNLFSQNASTREWTIFRKGVSEYQKGNYDMALQSFSLMISKLPNSALSTANHLMLAKTNYKAGDYEVSLRQCEEFKQNFPNSKYIDDINYLMANNYYRLNRTETAVKTWLETGFLTNDEVLESRSFNIADDVIRYKMNRISLQEMYDKNSGSIIVEALKFHLADYAYRNGNKSFARSELNLMLPTMKSVHYKEKATHLLDIIGGKNIKGEIRFAALLPLSGANAEIGQSVLNGLKLGINQYNSANKQKLVLAEFDYASHMIDAVNKMKEISSDPNISFVFGPLENDIVAACAVIAEYEGITLLSPTASSDEITDLSKNYVALAPSVKEMSAFIEEFAFDSLGIKRVATFTPMDDYFIKMTEEFKNAHIEKGGEVAAQEWYYPGDQDFKKQFRILKRIGLKLEFIDSLMIDNPEISQETIDTSYVSYLKREREKLEETKTKLDSADIPVEAFDGMFIPVYEDDITFMASQFAYSNFKTQVLGNSDWYNKDALKKNRNYINGIVFVTDGYLNEESWDFRQFRNNYRDTFKKTPGKYELIAYDCFKYVSNVFQKNLPINRGNFLRELKALPLYRGIYRNFSIGADRSNKSARILKYMFGQISPVR